MSFDSLSLIEPLLKAIRSLGYETPTPIQTQAIPQVLTGRDLLGCAQTGTGKTAAFALPVLQRLAGSPPVLEEVTRSAPAMRDGRRDYRDRRDRRGPAQPVGPKRAVRALVLTPTRELAAQIGETFRDLGRELTLQHTVVYGGVGYGEQQKALRNGVDILIATPGRLMDYMERGSVTLSNVEVLVLDEADQMLDMGFIQDVRRIVSRVPATRQTLFFSATMPKEIRRLADEWLKDPIEVSVAPPATTVERVQQKVFFVETSDKRKLLQHLLEDRNVTRALVFARTKHGANRIAEILDTGGIPTDAIHGNKSQNAREKALNDLKKGKVLVLVATDIAARGLDIEEVSHVINFDLPNVPEAYVHRIGRTARAGLAGVAWSFCNTEEREYLRDIERITRQKIEVATDHPFASPVPPPAQTFDEHRKNNQQKRPPNRNDRPAAPPARAPVASPARPAPSTSADSATAASPANAINSEESARFQTPAPPKRELRSVPPLTRTPDRPRETSAERRPFSDDRRSGPPPSREAPREDRYDRRPVDRDRPAPRRDDAPVRRDSRDAPPPRDYRDARPAAPRDDRGSRPAPDSRDRRDDRRPAPARDTRDTRDRPAAPAPARESREPREYRDNRDRPREARPDAAPATKGGERPWKPAQKAAPSAPTKPGFSPAGGRGKPPARTGDDRPREGGPSRDYSARPPRKKFDR